MSYTPEEIERDKRIIAAATRPPWHKRNKVGYVYSDPEGCVVATCGDFHDKELVPFNAERWNADADFIAAARTGWPKALEAIEARDKKIERLKAENERLQRSNAEIAMNGYRWMAAHDRLKAGLSYDFPTPADLPKAEAERDEAVRLLREARDELFHSVGHVGCIGCVTEERIDAFLAKVKP